MYSEDRLVPVLEDLKLKKITDLALLSDCDDEFQSEAANLAEEKVAFDGTRVAVDSATASVAVGSAVTSVSTTSVSSRYDGVDFQISLGIEKH